MTNQRRQIPETLIVPGKRLGRSINHDPRSRAYAFTATTPVVIATVQHERFMRILDQGNVGMCTGAATVGALGTNPHFPVLPAGVDLTEAEAALIYSAATKIDPFSGSYPPTDTGSDGLSVAKIAKNLGLIDAYSHAFDLQTALTALMFGPVLTGVNWYAGFDDPDADGLVSISGPLRGGHEVVVVGVDAEAKTVTMANSWGPGYGKAGYFKWSWATWQRLLDEEGDVTVLLPLTVPAPVLNSTDEVFARSLHIWLDKTPWFYKGIQLAARVWLKSRNL